MTATDPLRTLIIAEQVARIALGRAVVANNAAREAMGEAERGVREAEKATADYVAAIRKDIAENHPDKEPKP